MTGDDGEPGQDGAEIPAAQPDVPNDAAAPDNTSDAPASPDFVAAPDQELGTRAVSDVSASPDLGEAADRPAHQDFDTRAASDVPASPDSGEAAGRSANPDFAAAGQDLGTRAASGVPAGPDFPAAGDFSSIPANPAFAAQPYPGPPVGLPWGFIGFFAGYGGFYLVSLIITGAIAAVAIDPDAVQANLRGPAVLLALLPNLLLGIGPAVLSWWRGNGPRRDFGMRWTWSDVSTGFTCGVVALVVGLVVNLVLQEFVFHQPQQSVGQELGQLAGGRSIWLVFALVWAVILAPLNEEMLMRGALWGALEYYRVPKLMILGLTALVFALLHQEPTLTLALFAQGVAIGVARMRTGGIGASMVAHATNNFLPAVVLWFASKS